MLKSILAKLITELLVSGSCYGLYKLMVINCKYDVDRYFITALILFIWLAGSCMAVLPAKKGNHYV